MNTPELTQKLYEISSNQTKWAMNYCTYIINEIIRQYLTRTDYYENHAIKTLNNFFETGILVF